MCRGVLNSEWFSSIKRAQAVIETWLKQYNYIRLLLALYIRLLVLRHLIGKRYIELGLYTHVACVVHFSAFHPSSYVWDRTDTLCPDLIGLT